MNTVTVAFQVSTGTSLDDSESETFDVTDSKFEIDRVMPRRIKFKIIMSLVPRALGRLGTE